MSQGGDSGSAILDMDRRVVGLLFAGSSAVTILNPIDEVLSALECVDYVTVFPEPTPHDILGRVKPDVLVKGGDYAPSEVVGREIVEAYGGDVQVLAFRRGLSSTDVVRKLAEV